MPGWQYHVQAQQVWTYQDSGAARPSVINGDRLCGQLFLVEHCMFLREAQYQSRRFGKRPVEYARISDLDGTEEPLALFYVLLLIRHGKWIDMPVTLLLSRGIVQYPSPLVRVASIR